MNEGKKMTVTPKAITKPQWFFWIFMAILGTIGVLISAFSYFHIPPEDFFLVAFLRIVGPLINLGILIYWICWLYRMRTLLMNPLAFLAPPFIMTLFWLLGSDLYINCRLASVSATPQHYIVLTYCVAVWYLFISFGWGLVFCSCVAYSVGVLNQWRKELIENILYLLELDLRSAEQQGRIVGLHDRIVDILKRTPAISDPDVRSILAELRTQFQEDLQHPPSPS